MNQIEGRSYILVFLFIIISSTLSAQLTGGYWGNQYGSRGLLLNGAVIASCDDESAIFYNPAGLGLTDDFGVAVSLITPTYNYVTTDDLLGDGSTFVDDGLGLAPGLVAAKWRPFESEKFNMGFTIFNRFNSEVSYAGRVVSEVAGKDDIFVGDLEYRKEIDETWVGIGMSFEIAKNLSFGATQFTTWRSEDLDLHFKKEFVDRNQPELLTSGWRSRFKYGYGTNAGLLSKFGLSWRPGNVKIGITYTTSTYGILITSADYKYDDIKVRSTGDSELTSNDRRTELQAYKSPWSLGGGLEFTMGNTRLSLSAEYFTEVEPYKIIDDTDDPLDGLATGSDPVTTTISQGFDKVLNVAIGMERTLNKSYSWFLGGRTDFSPQSVLDLGENISFLASDPDVFHISIGGAYSYRKSKFSAGVDYGFGAKTNGRQLIDLSDVSDENLFIINGKDNVETFSHSLTLFVTYDL